MITTNLLPINNFRARADGKAFLTYIGLLAFTTIVILFGANQFVLKSTITKITAENEALQSTLTETQKKVAGASALTTSTVSQWQQLEAILELEERRRDQTRLLVKLDELLPKNNSWLLSLSNNKGTVNIEGIATDRQTVSQFLAKLQGEKFLKDVRLDITQNMVINNIKLTQFKINAKAAFPGSVIMSEGLPESGLPSSQDFITKVQVADPALAQMLGTTKSLSRRRPL